MLRWPHRYVPTPSDDPVYLYQDALVGIIPERDLNNAQPWLHAMLIAAAAPRPGEHVVHIGAGVGYYTAILAHMVGESGRVTAIEFDGGLAERLAANFTGQPNGRALQGDGAQIEFDPADLIYVNAGATRPADIWLDRLNDSGLLIPPLTSDKGFGENPENIPIQRRGAVFRIERRGDEFLAKWISAVAIFPCEGARDAECERALGGVREGRLGPSDMALSAQRPARGSVLAKGAGLVPGLRLRSVCRLLRCAHSDGSSVCSEQLWRLTQAPPQGGRSIALPRRTAFGALRAVPAAEPERPL